MATNIAFVNLLAVVAIAVAVPLGLGLAPRLRFPGAVFEIAAGVLVGPSALGLVAPDTVVQVMSVLGLAILLFLAGLEIDVDSMRGPLFRRAMFGFGGSIVLGLAVGEVLYAVGLVGQPLLVAVILSASAVGLILPVLKDAGETGSAFGQTVIAGAAVAEFGSIVLLSLLFSRQSTSGVTQLILLAGLTLLAVVAVIVIRRAEHVGRLVALLRKLQETTAQIRVRTAFLILVGFVALAQVLGLEIILGAYFAGVIVAVVDRNWRATHPLFRTKLEAVGFGVFIPIFFVTSGMTIDVGSLLADPIDLALVPIFLGGLLLVRGLPALLYRGTVGGRRTAAAGLLQATSLPFIVAATQIGLDLGLLRPATAAGLVAAGLLSVLLFPVSALALLRDGPAPGAGSD